MAAEVKATLSLDQSQFQAGINKAGANLNAFATGQLGAIKGQLAAAFTVGAITSLMSSAVEVGSRFADLAKITGVSSVELQKLDFAARQSGTSIEEIIPALKKLSVAIVDARGGGKETSAAFERLGISAEELKSLSADEVFLQIADAVKNASDPTQTMADIVQVLGRSANELKPLMMEGSAGIRNLMNAAEAAGVVMSDDLTKAMDEVGDRMEILKRRWTVIGAGWAIIASDMADHVTRLGAGLELTIAQAMGDAAGAEAAFLRQAAAIDSLTGATARNAEAFKKRAAEAGKGGQTEEEKKEIQAQDDDTIKSAMSEAKRGIALISERGKLEEQNRLAEMDHAQLLQALYEKRFELEQAIKRESDPTTQLAMEVERLKIQGQYQATFRSMVKERERESEKTAKDFERKTKEQADVRDDIEKIKEGKGVSAPDVISDSLARIGGFVGGTGDQRARMAERQVAIQEKMREYLAELVRQGKEIPVELDVVFN